METRNSATLSLLVLFASFAASQEPGGKCMTPNGLLGECIEINSCEYVMSMIKSRLSTETINAVRKYQCGFQGSQPLVCCPGEVPQQSPPSEHPNLRLLPRSSCGYINSHKLVTPNAFLYEYPWVAILKHKNEKEVRMRCAGVIINERYILTAAHCITELPEGLELDSVRLGEHNLGTDPDCEGDDDFKMCASPAEDYDIEEVIPHPQFDKKSMQNDIGLLRLDRTINFARDSTQPICLPMETKELPWLLIVGWGITMEGISSQEMLWASVKPVDGGACAESYKKWVNINNSTQICIEPEYLGSSRQCVGDIGGPLMGVSSGRAEVRGVMSFAAGVCGSGTLPRVYSLVEPYVDWILSTMKE